MAFLVVKYIHILAAIVAIGLNISYAVWIIRAQRDPAHMSFALKGIKFLDDRIANPAYGLLLLSGILMVFLVPYPITTLWIVVALVLYVVLVVLAISQYTPTPESASSSLRPVIRPRPSSPPRGTQPAPGSHPGRD